MHVVLTHHTNQSIRKEGIDNLIELLEFVRTEWDRFTNSQRRTMRDLVIPAHITHIVIDGELYEFSNPRCRNLWFGRDDKGAYNPDRFYISEVTDLNGHAHQLHLDRSLGTSYDDLHLVQARRLYGRPIARTYAATGPLVRD